ncbi:hypothetical protein Mapa_009904 [Marchantia paleacea]|nr:hypothetical protein Mapa_009904 [Marchantia paleacea]
MFASLIQIFAEAGTLVSKEAKRGPDLVSSQASPDMDTSASTPWPGALRGSVEKAGGDRVVSYQQRHYTQKKEL